MKHTRVVLSLLFLMSAGMVLADSASATPYFNIRSQSANLALEMVGQEGYINRYDSNGNYTVLSFTPAYQQSFRSGDLACCLFGNDLVQSGDCAQLTISGSQFANRGENDWLADYFGLPTDFKSTIQFNPRIRNVLVDGNFYFGLDEWWHPGMYFRMHIPFVHTRWELDYCETVSARGVNNHPFGYFSGNTPPTSDVPSFQNNNIGNLRSELLCNAESFFSDCKAPELSNARLYPPVDNAETAPALTPAIITDEIVFEPLNYARWAGCNCSPLTKSGVAEWRFTLGYNAYMSDKFHVGFGLTGAAPTGNRPHGQFMFEPIIGNGNHWELGGQFTSHYRFWQSEDEMKKLTGYLDANLTHLFKTRQTRSFDLKGKPNSRYMLAQKLGNPCQLNHYVADNRLTTASGIPANADIRVDALKADSAFKDHYAPVANLTTVDVDVNIGAQVDMVLMLNYTTYNWSFDLGYNLWARTCERIKLNCDCPTRLSDGQTWALKGDAQVYGATTGLNPANPLPVTQVNHCTRGCDPAAQVEYLVGVFDDASPFISQAPYPVGATQSKATIHSGTNSTTTNIAGAGNKGIDSPRFAMSAVNVVIQPETDTDTSSGMVTAFLPMVDRSNLNNPATINPRIATSKNPIYLTENDIDFDGAATKGLSHKVFGHVSYQWLDSERGYTPFFGFGGSGEFVNNDGDCCPSSCDTNTSCEEKCKDDCKRCALSQWSVWVKGGFSFD